MSPGAIIRTRRYVSAPAGSYQQPKMAPGTRSTSGHALVGTPVAPDEGDLALRTARGLPASESAPSGVVARDPLLEEPAFERGQAALAAASEAGLGAEEARKPSRGSRGLVILVSGLAGILVGALAGLALLAFMEPARWMERFLDPLGLWNSTDDPLIRTSAIMIVVGCGLIGALLPLRLRR